MNPYAQDDWPTLSDGTDWDGKELPTLIRDGISPFKRIFDVQTLIEEIEKALDAEVVDIPLVTYGAHHYGFHVKLSTSQDIIVRLARDDVNVPTFCGDDVFVQSFHVNFEATIFELFRSHPRIPTSPLLYYRAPSRDFTYGRPRHIDGRRIFLFEIAQGRKLDWRQDLATDDRQNIAIQAGRIRAALFNFNPPQDFIAHYFLDRLYWPKPKRLNISVAPTRRFWIHVLESQLKATIKERGYMYDHADQIVGPRAVAAKKSLLRLIPYIMPPDDDPSLYRFVLEHGDFGLHNMSITEDKDRKPLITSLYDWELSYFAPAIFSDPQMSTWGIRLMADEHGNPTVFRGVNASADEEPSQERRTEYTPYSIQYLKRVGLIQAVFDGAPEYKRAIQSGKDARRIWIALRDLYDQDMEVYFGELGEWAESRLKELGLGTALEIQDLSLSSIPSSQLPSPPQVAQVFEDSHVENPLPPLSKTPSSHQITLRTSIEAHSKKYIRDGKGDIGAKRRKQPSRRTRSSRPSTTKVGLARQRRARSKAKVKTESK
ncbi:hypothetical protein H0H92_012607 [Tricholoma furcatifolium]|nr:hypothetical protein H0H92_012607 [Tricholoma furcatifolium]